jgi:GNAT superfamily N-acetyltransferase
MRARDVAAGMRLKTLAGWNQVEEDWRFFIENRPQGCYVAVHEDTVIGTVTTVGYGPGLDASPRVAWISMLLVDPAYRGRGIGTRLMRTAVAGLARCPTVMLDATPAGKGLYERLGFREQSHLLRLAIERVLSPGGPAPDTPLARLQGQDDLERAAALDRAVFGADRTPLLRELARRAPQAAWLSARKGRPTGFCLGRNGTRGHGGGGVYQLGPLVATGPEEAIALCRAGLSACSGQAAVIDVPAHHEEFLAWLRGAGFAAQRPFTRMVLGTPLALPEAPARTFAICGPEFG